MAWAEPHYSVQEVNQAGRSLRKLYEKKPPWSDAELAEYISAITVSNNWRASHAYPLNTFQINLRSTCRRFDGNAIIAQRIKRQSSIANKLMLQKSMKLSQMQDLGGCRAILSSVANVERVVNYYLHKSAIKHERASVDDYIAEPKPSGYRGVHLVYRYFSDKTPKECYNGKKIEMQIRSRYQHAWATAVETVGTFSGQALKSSLGSDDWKRFFALMGSVIALREKAPPIPNTPTTRKELVDELRHYASSLLVEARLKQYNGAMSFIASDADDNDYYFLLKLDPNKATLVVDSYSAAESEDAEAAYAEAESELREKRGDAVLVSVDSVAALGKAYPNYFADTRVFLELMTQALKGSARGISI